ncbi:MAG TPA: transporter substrate-binding domain-containing protein [Bacillota bacterium]|nr:transporter substrate-binding domain-containing protein [Bacillota bacterium]HPF17791.1 transporter substrate-binding domain-containing protein [Thermotogota bacterium]
MRKLSLVLLLFFVLFSIVISQTVVLGNGEWKPYLSKTLKHGGYASHIVSEAFQNVGVTVEYQWFGDSWARAYSTAQTDEIDGTLIWSYEAERAESFYYSENPVIAGQRTLLYYLKTNPIDWDGTAESLEGHIIGGHIGYTYGEVIDPAIDEGLINFQMISSDSNNILKLSSGRIDGLMMNSQVANELMMSNLTQTQRDAITSSEIPVKEITYHLLLNKKDAQNKALMEQFDKGFDMLEESGRLAELTELFESDWYEQAE